MSQKLHEIRAHAFLLARNSRNQLARIPTCRPAGKSDALLTLPTQFYVLLSAYVYIPHLLHSNTNYAYNVKAHLFSFECKPISNIIRNHHRRGT